jgi:hypothetical protein
LYNKFITMKKSITTLLFSCCFSLLFAQETADPKQFVTAGLSGGSSDKLSLFSLPVNYHHGVGSINGLYYTVGVRQNLAFGRRIFTVNNQDALIDDISNYSFNAMAGVEYTYNNVLIGFNIDLVGINTGTRSYKTVGTDPIYKITPENLNMIGLRGCTNNEFYLGYRFSESFTARIGVSYYNMSLLYSNNRTAETSSYAGTLLPMVNIQYTLWQR